MKRKYMLAPYIMENTVNELRVFDIMRMTHLNISFGLIKDGAVTVDHLQYLDRIEKYKLINPDLKVILSIGGWGADGFSQAAETAEGLQKFADTAMEIVFKWDFDGIDIDWEYPCSDKAGIAYGPQDKVNFTLLMQKLRSSLDKGGEKTGKSYSLSCAVGGGDYFVEGTEMDKVSAVCDYINLMTYDLRGGFETVTGHHTSLYPQTGDESGPCGVNVVEMFYKAGVPYEKMVLGSAFYGRRWDKVTSTANNGLMQKSEGVGGGGGGFEEIKHFYVNKNGFTRYWDEQAKAPYLFNGESFISYDDEISVAEKCKYVKEKGLMGIMYWAYSSPTLFDVMAENLD